MLSTQHEKSIYFLIKIVSDVVTHLSGVCDSIPSILLLKSIRFLTFSHRSCWFRFFFLAWNTHAFADKRVHDIKTVFKSTYLENKRSIKAVVSSPLPMFGPSNNISAWCLSLQTQTIHAYFAVIVSWHPLSGLMCFWFHSDDAIYLHGMATRSHATDSFFSLLSSSASFLCVHRPFTETFFLHTKY